LIGVQEDREIRNRQLLRPEFLRRAGDLARYRLFHFMKLADCPLE